MDGVGRNDGAGLVVDWHCGWKRWTGGDMFSGPVKGMRMGSPLNFAIIRYTIDRR